MPVASDPTTLVGAGILVVAAALIAFLGYRIHHGERWLIAGYRSAEIQNEAAYGRLVGRTCLALATITALAGLALPIVGSTSTFWLVYTVIFVGALVVVAVLGRRYE